LFVSQHSFCSILVFLSPVLTKISLFFLFSPFFFYDQLRSSIFFSFFNPHQTYFLVSNVPQTHLNAAVWPPDMFRPGSKRSDIVRIGKGPPGYQLAPLPFLGPPLRSFFFSSQRRFDPLFSRSRFCPCFFEPEVFLTPPLKTTVVISKNPASLGLLHSFENYFPAIPAPRLFFFPRP